MTVYYISIFFSLIHILYSTLYSILFYMFYSIYSVLPFSGDGVENKTELQRVLEHRKREQMIRQRKQEEEARRKISPLEQELLKRHQKLEEVQTTQPFPPVILTWTNDTLFAVACFSFISGVVLTFFWGLNIDIHFIAIWVTMSYCSL